MITSDYWWNQHWLFISWWFIYWRKKQDVTISMITTGSLPNPKLGMFDSDYWRWIGGSVRTFLKTLRTPGWGAQIGPKVRTIGEMLEPILDDFGVDCVRIDMFSKVWFCKVIISYIMFYGPQTVMGHFKIMGYTPKNNKTWYKPYEIKAHYEIKPRGYREKQKEHACYKINGLTKISIKSWPITKSMGAFWYQIVEIWDVFKMFMFGLG